MLDEDQVKERKRRLASGLSENLLDHAEAGQNFLGFLSYRRQDGLALARWLRDTITNFKVPQELKEKIAARDASVGGRQNRVFLDMSYQKPNVDFWDEHIAASLCRSRTLILLQTPSVFQKLDNGESNWCEREIETFLKFHNDPSRILVVMGPGAPIDRFPAPLEKISARWDWIDLRFFSQSPFNRFRYGSQYDAQIVKVLAKVYDIADGDLPILGREFARARGRIRRNLGIAACLTIISLSALTVWALRERSRAFAAEEIAVIQRDNAVRERNAALVSQSRYLASSADDLIKRGTIRGAMTLLREALPDAEAGRERPIVHDAIETAYKAMYSNHEVGKLELPTGTTAIATDAMNDRTVIATRDQLLVRKGFSNENAQAWPLDFAETTHIALSPGAKFAALTASDGTVMVRDLGDNRVILRDPGQGAGTKASFVSGGTMVLISDPQTTRLRLFNVSSGALVASRVLNVTNAKPVISFFDPDSDVMMLVANDKLLRLSAVDLTDAAMLAIDPMDEYALALSQDKATVYLAAAHQVLDGHMLEVDAASWTLKRSFSNIVWGAKQLAVSSRWGTLALIGLNGVDFFDLKSGERTSHVATTFEPTGGQFLGGRENSDYMIYGKDGSIRWISPILGIETSAFMTIDGGAIRELDPLPGGKGFLSLSDLPSVTQWSYGLTAIAGDYNIPLIKGGIDFKTATLIHAFNYDEASNSATASYSGNAVYRWNIATGAATMVKASDDSKDEIAFVSAFDTAATLVANSAGKLNIYSSTSGPDKALSQLDLGPLSNLAAVSPTQAFVVTKKGEPSLIDFSAAADPKLMPLADLAPCPLSAAIPNYVICGSLPGRLVFKRISDGKIVFQRPDSSPPFTYADISKDGRLIAIADKDGRLQVWQSSDGKVIYDSVLQEDLRGVRLAAALNSGKLSPDEMTAVLNGGRQLTKTLAAANLGFSADGKLLAIALPFGFVKILNLETKQMSEILTPQDSAVSELVFSAHNGLLGVHEVGKIEVREVFNVASGERLASISLSGQLEPKTFPLPDGHGFLTIEKFGHIIVNPVFEDDKDFIAYLAREFPEKLTPAQRRAYFLE